MKKLVAIALLLVPSAFFVIGCSRPPEQQFLTQFFRAARGRDNSTVGKMSAVELDPRTQGTVESFDIENVSPETRTPLTLMYSPFLYDSRAEFHLKAGVPGLGGSGPLFSAQPARNKATPQTIPILILVPTRMSFMTSQITYSGLVLGQSIHLLQAGGNPARRDAESDLAGEGKPGGRAETISGSSHQFSSNFAPRAYSY